MTPNEPTKRRTGGLPWVIPSILADAARALERIHLDDLEGARNTLAWLSHEPCCGDPPSLESVVHELRAAIQHLTTALLHDDAAAQTHGAARLRNAAAQLDALTTQPNETTEHAP